MSRGRGTRSSRPSAPLAHPRADTGYHTTPRVIERVVRGLRGDLSGRLDVEADIDENCPTCAEGGDCGAAMHHGVLMNNPRVKCDARRMGLILWNMSDMFTPRYREAMDRLVAQIGIGPDDFDITLTQGYYGDEVESVRLRDPEPLCAAMTEMLSLPSEDPEPLAEWLDAREASLFKSA